MLCKSEREKKGERERERDGKSRTPGGFRPYFEEHWGVRDGMVAGCTLQMRLIIYQTLTSGPLPAGHLESRGLQIKMNFSC